MLVGTGRCEEDGGPSDDFISRDNRKSISKTNCKQQEATRNRRGSSSVVEPETRKHQSLSTRQKKKNPLEKDNAVGKESNKLAFNENSKKKNLKSKSESTSTTTSTTTVQAGNAVGENVMANNNNGKPTVRPAGGTKRKVLGAARGQKKLQGRQEPCVVEEGSA